MQLQLLTRRHDAPPSQTWGQDVGRALSAAFTRSVFHIAKSTWSVSRGDLCVPLGAP
jgi:hypothetical protein